MNAINQHSAISREFEAARSSRSGSFSQHFSFGNALSEFVDNEAIDYGTTVPVTFGPELERGLIWAGLGLCISLVLLFAAPGFRASTTNTWVLPTLELLTTLKWWLVGPSLISLGLYFHLYFETQFIRGNEEQLYLATGLMIFGWLWFAVLGILIVPILLNWLLILVSIIVMIIVQVVLPAIVIIVVVILAVLGMLRSV